MLKSYKEKYAENLKKYGPPPASPVFTCAPIPSPPREINFKEFSIGLPK
jgi:hypothetical protein